MSKVRLISNKSNNSIFKVQGKPFGFCTDSHRIERGDQCDDDTYLRCFSIIEAACWYLYYDMTCNYEEFKKKFVVCGSPEEMSKVMLDMFDEETIVNACVQAMADRALHYPAYLNQLLDRQDPNQTKHQKPMCDESLKTAPCVLDSDDPIFGHGLKVDPRSVDRSDWKGKNIGGKIIEMAREYVLEHEEEFNATGELPEMLIFFPDANDESASDSNTDDESDSDSDANGHAGGYSIQPVVNGMVDAAFATNATLVRDGVTFYPHGCLFPNFGNNKDVVYQDVNGNIYYWYDENGDRHLNFINPLVAAIANMRV